LSHTSLARIQQDLQSGKTTFRKIVEHYLGNIRNNAHLNCFLEVYEDEALARAAKIDKKIQDKQAGKLAGLVVALKDVLCFTGHKLQASSKILEGFESQFSATAVERLIKEDAIIIGRNNCDEFAMGSSNENSAYDPVLNNIDNERVPGGSSGGSAVSVQADMCLAALGTDTGGSIRQPAAFCGLVGMKPTYSRISRHGLLSYASSFDVIGILSRNVDDNARVLSVIAGKDNFDSTVSSRPTENYESNLRHEGNVKIAYLNEIFENKAVQPEIKKSFEDSLERLRSMGHRVRGIDFPLLDYVLPTYYILTTAEASSNLARYDGVKYGCRTDTIDGLESMYKRSRTEGFGEEVRRRILLGTFVLSASYYDAYYTKAQKVRRLIRDATIQLFKEYEFIVLPTTPSTAFKLGEHSDNPLEMYTADLLTVQASISGIPSISLPVNTNEKGLPVGLQIMANEFEEKKLLAFSKSTMDSLSLAHD